MRKRLGNRVAFRQIRYNLFRSGFLLSELPEWVVLHRFMANLRDFAVGNLHLSSWNYYRIWDENQKKTSKPI